MDDIYITIVNINIDIFKIVITWIKEGTENNIN